MSQAPSMTDFGSPAPYAEPERTSVMALLSLISSIVCCIPGLSLIGILLGIGSLVSIGGSGGRVGGKGMAWAGVILGVLVTMLWAGLLIGGLGGARALVDMAKQQIEPRIEAIDAGDFDTARELLTTDAKTQATDEAFEALRATYQPAIGGFDTVPENLGDWLDGWGSYGPAMQSYQGRQMLPIVYSTENGGSVLVLLMLDPAAQPDDPSQPFAGMVENIIIILPDMSEARLLP